MYKVLGKMARCTAVRSIEYNLLLNKQTVV